MYLKYTWPLGLTPCILLLVILLFKTGCTKKSNSLVIASFWSGAVDDHSACVTARFSNQGRVRLVVSEDSLNFSDPHYSEYYAIDPVNDGYVTFDITNLSSNTQYYYTFHQAGADLVPYETGKFKTFQDTPFSYKLAFSACGKTGSTRTVYKTIKNENPLFYLATGDLFYGDISINCQHQFEQYYDSTLQSPAQAELYHSTPIAYMWDDHDFGPGNSAGNSSCKEIAKNSYKKYVPHYPFTLKNDTMPLSQSFTVGRVRFLLTDLRSAKKKPIYNDCELIEEGSNFGLPEHLNWFKQELVMAKDQEQLIAWVSGIPFINYPGGPNYDCDEDDDWGGYQHERQEIINFIEENDINICILSGDAHMVAIDDGTHSSLPYSNRLKIPVFHAASLDKHGTYKGGPYSHGYHPEGGQYGVMTVIDDGGDDICIEWVAKNEKNEVVINEAGNPIQYRFCRTLVAKKDLQD